MKVGLVAILFLLTGCQANIHINTPEQPATRPTEVSMAEYCSQHECRGRTTIKLKTEGADFVDEMPFFWPVVQDNVISVLPGEKVHIQAEVGANGAVVPSKVSKPGQPANTLVFRLSQNETDVGMQLFVHNPLDKPLKYTLEWMDFRGRIRHTRSCPVAAGTSRSDSWPHPIVQLFITRPHVLLQGEAAECD